MIWTFDQDADSIYVYLAAEPAPQPAAQVELPDGLVVDLAEDDSAIGVEILSASRGWDLVNLATYVSGRDIETLEGLRAVFFKSRFRFGSRRPVQPRSDGEGTLASAPRVKVKMIS